MQTGTLKRKEWKPGEILLGEQCVPLSDASFAKVAGWLADEMVALGLDPVLVRVQVCVHVVKTKPVALVEMADENMPF